MPHLTALAFSNVRFRHSLEDIGCIVQSSQHDLREILRECKELQNLLHLSQANNCKMLHRLNEMQARADSSWENSHCEANASFERIETNLQDGRREACHNFDELRRSIDILQSNNANFYDRLVGNLREVHDHLDRVELTAFILPKSIQSAIESLKSLLCYEKTIHERRDFSHWYVTLHGPAET